MTEAEFLKRFEDMSLPECEFDHKGHLWLGWLYIRDCGLASATQKLNQGIKNFASSLGATDKFHCTLTTTFACAIKSRFKEDETFEQFLTRNDDPIDQAMTIIQTHYSPNLLFSAKARDGFVWPDKEPFPKEFESELKKVHGGA